MPLSTLFRNLLKVFITDENRSLPGGNKPAANKQPISVRVDDNIRKLQSIFKDCSDVVIREFKINAHKPVKAYLIYVDGLVDDKTINQHVLRALQSKIGLAHQVKQTSIADLFTTVKEQLLPVVEIDTATDLQKLITHTMAGDSALLLDGLNTAIVIDAKQWEMRAVNESQSEPLVRGPRDGFTETLRINTAMLRRRIRTPNLKMEMFQVGRISRTDIVVAYIDTIANPKVVEEIRSRIKRIDIDGILESAYLEEFIEDKPFTVFPQVDSTERPDKAAASLLEGKVIIVVDNTPFCLIMPIAFSNLLQTSEDYYLRSIYASFIRILRFISINIALLLPALYIAIVTYHQEMLPTPLFISIAGQREGVPFPAFVEAFFMITVFEILREAGVRMPKPIGQAISIVGGLVLGTAAVDAGLVSPFMVMVIATTAIASFTLPNISVSYATRVLQFPFMFLAAALGLFGITAGLMGILIHICSLRSFGYPYLSPFAPTNFGDLKDMFIRVPHWAMISRPHLEAKRNPTRQSPGRKPGTYFRGNNRRGGWQ